MGRIGAGDIGFGLAASAVAAAQIACIVLSSLDLSPQETAAWAWSLVGDWGRLHAPPLPSLAAFLGDRASAGAPWGLRVPVATANAVAGLALYAAAKARFGGAGAWIAGLGWLLAPGAWLALAQGSSASLLAAATALGLGAFLSLRATHKPGSALLLGASLALAGLSSHTGLALAPMLLLVCAVDRDSRAALLSWNGLGALMTAALMLTPHAAALLDGRAPAALAAPAPSWAESVSRQALAAGLLAPLALALALGLRRPGAVQERPLAALTFAALVVMAIEAALRFSDHAWAIALPAALLWAAARVSRGGALAGLPGWALSANALAAVAAGVLLARPTDAERLGLTGAFGPGRAWEPTARILRAQASLGFEGRAFTAAATADPSLFYALAFHWRGESEAPPLRYFGPGAAPQARSGRIDRLSRAVGEPVLVVTVGEAQAPAPFAAATPIASIAVPLSPSASRPLTLAAGRGLSLAEAPKP